MEGTTQQTPIAEVTVYIDIKGWQPVKLNFKKECSLTKNPEHYIDVYGDDGEEVVVKGTVSAKWEPSDRDHLMVVEKKTKEFSVRLDRDSSELHFPLSVASTNPFIVDIQSTGALKRKGFLSETSQTIKIRHFCRDLGTSVISLSLPLTHSESLHWSYIVSCKSFSSPTTSYIVTANQLMFLICVILAIVSFVVYSYWEVIEDQFSSFFYGGKKRSRKGNLKIQKNQDIDV